MDNNLLTQILRWSAPFMVFILFICTFALIYFAAPDRIVHDDVFYHMAHSLQYANGNADGAVFNYPVYSTLSTKPVDLWYGFHRYLALFLIDFDGTNFEYVVRQVKFAYSLLVGLLFSAFYFVAYTLGSRLLNLPTRKSVAFGILSAIILYCICGFFNLRLILLRPHIISISCFLLSYYSLVYRKYWLLFILAAMLPTFYSASFLIIIPSLVYILAYVIYYGIRLTKKESFYPVLVTFAGLVLGIALRPDSMNYIYNGYYVPFMSIFSHFVLSSASTKIQELQMYHISTVDLMWILTFALSFVLFVFKCRKQNNVYCELSFQHYYLSLLTGSLFMLFIVVSRWGEYFFPFLVLFVVFTTHMVLGDTKTYWLSRKKDDGSLFYPVYSLIHRFLDILMYEKHRICYAIIILLPLLFISMTVGLVNTSAAQDSFVAYRNAAEFIENDSGGKGLVFTQYFHMYPPLVLFNPENKYIMGMDPVYTYLYGKELFFEWQNIINENNICSLEPCANTEQNSDIYESIKNEFKASYVFIDAVSRGGTEKRQITPKFISALEKDSRFKKVFFDPEYMTIIYKL